MADDKFEFESVQDCRTIQKYLQALQEGFAHGRILVNSDGSEICLHPAGFMKFEVNVKKKGSDNKLGIKISWKDASEMPTPAEPIFISS